jgi:hypothetical protein
MKKPNSTTAKAKPTRTTKPTAKAESRSPMPTEERPRRIGDIWEDIYIDAFGKRSQKKERLENKTQQTLTGLVAKAKAGNENAFIKLVGIDKIFLCEPWAKMLIFEAEISENQHFFDRLATAIQKKPFKKSPSNEKTLHILETLFEYKGGIFLSMIQKHRGCRMVHDYLNKDGKIPDTLSDYDYFRKFLARHGFIKRTPKV